MKIVVNGFDLPVVVKAGELSAFRIESATLYARICASLLSGLGEDALEPYSIWTSSGQRVSALSTIVVANPLNLPWDDKSLSGRLYERMDKFFREDEEARLEIEKAAQALRDKIIRLTFQAEVDYTFALEWSLKQQLKAFSFRVDRPAASGLLETLNTFLDYCADLAPEKLLVFVGLENFLSTKHLQEVKNRVFFHGLHVLTLEKYPSGLCCPTNNDRIVDLQFLES